MKFLSFSLSRLVIGLVGLLLAPLVLHAQQTVTATAGQVGVAYSYQVTTTPAAPAGTTYAATGLPSGLAINTSSGLITGTPTTPGTVIASISLTSSGTTNSGNFSFTIAAAAATSVITSPTTASGTVGAAFSYVATASNSPTSFNITGLPAGLSATAAGVISGTPTAAGASSISLSANNAGGTGATVTLALTISAPASAPVITSASTASVAVSASFSYTVTATNTPTSFAASGLPLGLSIDTATGAITGTPTVAGVYTIGLSATNAGGTSATFNLALTVGALSAITSSTTSTAAVGAAYTYTVTASPAATSFNISGLPAGLTANTSTGVISGTPTAIAAGVLSVNSSVSLSANNATGSGPVTILTLTVGNRPAITSATSASGTVGSAFNYAITASNSPTSYAATGLPAGLSVNTATGAISGTPTAAGASSVSLSATNAFGTGGTTTLAISIATPAPNSTAPVFTTQPQSATVAVGGSVTLLAVAVGAPTPTYQWQKNGANIAGANGGSLALSNLQAGDAGSYTVVASNSAGSATSQAAVVGITSTVKVSGAGTVVASSVVHPNGNVYDQVLLTGTSATVTADAGKVTRISFIDLTDDIVQVEFSGAGTLSVVLDAATGPAAPVNYNQSGVTYMKGHANLVVAGADDTSNLTVFSVGRATAFDPTGAYNIALPISATNNPANTGSPLFAGHAATVYDGVADIGSVTISSTNGKFGGVRTANASYFATAGNTGIYAPGVQFTGPVYVGDINASGSATPVLLLGSAGVTQINGGDLLQSNAQPVKVSGITHLQFVAGVTSQNVALPAQTNKAVLQQNGVDVTSTIVFP
jgi:hypothetical protein